MFTRPAFQNGFTASPFRSVPDISADGDPNTGINICVQVLGYSCTGGGTGQLYGGTSLSTPEWAAGVALLQQVLGPLGNFGPFLYQTYTSAGAKGFHTTASMLPSARGATNDFAHLGLGSYDLGALLADLSSTTPAFSCAVLSPTVGTGDTCTTTLTGPLPAGTTILAQAGAPSGTTLSACSATGGIACGAASASGQSLSCAGPCPIGANFSLLFTSPSIGLISEALSVNAPGVPSQG